MFEIPADLKGVDEIEAKILHVDTEEVERRLLAAGAQREGHFAVTEQRYHSNEAMRAAGFSGPRLRLLSNACRDQIEIAFKQKLPSLPLPGREDLGLPCKRRNEIEFTSTGAWNSEQGFQLMRMLLDDLFARRGFMLSGRTRFLQAGISYQIDSIRSADGSTERLPPPFLEIEGPSPAAILEAARAIGFNAEDLQPSTKQEMVEAHRQQTSVDGA
ncbi:hypothetical protein AUJ46_02260 [Candidatus Peregrinibacteria bacterium CG1_02_54_53]|nr:MAG: hypothetical protein AUJ46_02260 [Candidatus Peregrinibacteria bacterium CG1_02_54_53]